MSLWATKRTYRNDKYVPEEYVISDPLNQCRFGRFVSPSTKVVVQINHF